MSDSTPQNRLLEAIADKVPLPVLQDTEKALAIAPELIDQFRIAWRAKDHRVDSVWLWMEGFVATCEANPALEPFRRPTFLALLQAHNHGVDIPIIVSGDQLPNAIQIHDAPDDEPQSVSSAKTVDTLSTMVDIAPPSNEGAAA